MGKRSQASCLLKPPTKMIIIASNNRFKGMTARRHSLSRHSRGEALWVNNRINRFSVISTAKMSASLSIHKLKVLLAKNWMSLRWQETPRRDLTLKRPDHRLPSKRQRTIFWRIVTMINHPMELASRQARKWTIWCKTPTRIHREISTMRMRKTRTRKLLWTTEMRRRKMKRHRSSSPSLRRELPIRIRIRIRGDIKRIIETYPQMNIEKRENEWAVSFILCRLKC